MIVSDYITWPNKIASNPEFYQQQGLTVARLQQYSWMYIVGIALDILYLALLIHFSNQYARKVMGEDAWQELKKRQKEKRGNTKSTDSKKTDEKFIKVFNALLLVSIIVPIVLAAVAVFGIMPVMAFSKVWAVFLLGQAVLYFIVHKKYGDYGEELKSLLYKCMLGMVVVGVLVSCFINISDRAGTVYVITPLLIGLSIELIVTRIKKRPYHIIGIIAFVIVGIALMNPSGLAPTGSSNRHSLTCSVCGKTYYAGDSGGNYMSIAKSGMCVSCHDSFQGAKDALEQEGIIIGK